MGVTIIRSKTNTKAGDSDLIQIDPLGRHTVALLGDSLTVTSHPANGGSTVAAPAVPTDGKEYRNDSWFHWANAFLYQRFKPVAFGGVGGENLAQMYARINTLLAYSPRYMFVMGGTNDVTNGRTAAQMFSSWRSIVEACQDAGTIPIVMPCQPNGNYTTTAYKSVYMDYNWQVEDYARAMGGCIFVDPFRMLVDQSLSVPQFPTSKLNAADVVHWNGIGHMDVGYQLYLQLKDLIPAVDVFPSFSHPYMTSVDNPLMLGTAGTDGTAMTGDTATGWTSNANGAGAAGVGSKVARADYPGEWQQIAITGQADNGDTEMRSASVTFANSGLAVGDTIVGFAELSFDGSNTNAGPPQVSLVVDGGATGTALAHRGESADEALTNPGIPFVVATPELVILASATGCRFVSEFFARDGVGAYNARYGRHCIRKIGTFE